MRNRSVILVGGDSDRGALETLARRLGLDLIAEQASIVAMGGATNIGRFLERYGPAGEDAGLAGLCDAGEEPVFAHALERGGVWGRPHARRSGTTRLLRLCRGSGGRTDPGTRRAGRRGDPRLASRAERAPDLHRQPAWRDRPIDEQLRRFFGTFGGRKIRSAPLLVEALDLERVPRPLEAVLRHASSRVRGNPHTFITGPELGHGVPGNLPRWAPPARHGTMDT